MRNGCSPAFFSLGCRSPVRALRPRAVFRIIAFPVGSSFSYKPPVSVMSHHDVLSATTRFCGVFGQPIKHSASPAMHNPAMASLGLNWRYLAFEVNPNRLAQALEGCRAMRFIGVNLTVPHKLLAVALMDVLDPSAQEWGAVNTVAFEARDPDGTWRPVREFEGSIPEEIRARGYNTDADAILRALEEDLDFQARGSRVLILGAGGAGRVAAMKLASAGAAELFLVNRTESKAASVGAEIVRRFPETRVTVGYPKTPIDLALNATSLGLNASDALPLDVGLWSVGQSKKAYDMIYRPAQTPFLALAKDAGCETANGLGMLLYQGAQALEIWSGRKAPVDLMRDALRKQVYG